MGEGTPKTNDHCPHMTNGKCKKLKKACNNRTNFYMECNTYIGNKSLGNFF
jgi:hypothetical protein